jgi:hypothetical protein
LGGSFQGVKHANNRLLFFVDIAENVDLGEFLSTSLEFKLYFDGIFEFHFGTLDDNVMHLVFVCHYQKLLLTDESNTQAVRVAQGVSLDNLALLQVDIIKA